MCASTVPPGDYEAPSPKCEDDWHGGHVGSLRSWLSSRLSDRLTGLGPLQTAGPEAEDSNHPAPLRAPSLPSVAGSAAWGRR